MAPPSSAGLTHETKVLPSEPPPYYVGDTARGRRGLGGAGGGGGPGAVAGGVDGPHLHVIVDVVGQSAKGNLPPAGAGSRDAIPDGPVGVGLVRRVAADVAQVVGGDARPAGV